MDTKYNHQLIEQSIGQKWTDHGFFVAKVDASSTKNYTIILPPPNITGRLHLGHAWDGFIQDTLIRWKKLQGFNVLFLPSMDHAGISTQVKIEQRLREQLQLTRHDLGRTAFLQKASEWKVEYSQIIKSQWQKMGLALDYTKERFTLDNQSIEAVAQVFVKMAHDNLIYRGARGVNWDAKLQTVLSDIEVVSIEKNQTMYYIKYPIVGGSFVEVATTRLETMFSDVALAFHPDDPRYKGFEHKKAISPLTGRELPFIKSETIMIDKGTGVMKVSAHAMDDIKLIFAHQLPLIESIDRYGQMTSIAGELASKDRFVARELLATKLAHAIIKTEAIVSNVGVSERSGEVVEILVQPQWFVKMDRLAQHVLDHLQSDDAVNFFPHRFSDVLREWMEKAEDWCISRQLWWGHRIPAWYKNNEVKVSLTAPGEDWVQDEDVLDTWFSSALSPFVFLKWPQSKEWLAQFYPTSLLVTGYDIIFFWVARMYFQSLYLINQKPFQDVLIHGLIRADDGRKMSKSLGNGIDPMDEIDKYGADALRFFLLTNSSPGQDLRYSSVKVEAAWNLNNKLWNIARYILEAMPRQVLHDDNSAMVDQWITQKLHNLQLKITHHMQNYDLTIVGKELTQFIMEDFSAWYIELTKAAPNFQSAKTILSQFLVLAHPFLPFITDFLYQQINNEEILNQRLPKIEISKEKLEVDNVIMVISALRQFRVQKNLSHNYHLQFCLTKVLQPTSLAMIFRLTNSSYLSNNDALVNLQDFDLYVKLDQALIETEQARLIDEKKWLESEILRANQLLNNQAFCAKAPAAKLQLEKNKLQDFQDRLARLEIELSKK